MTDKMKETIRDLLNELFYGVYPEEITYKEIPAKLKHSYTTKLNMSNFTYGKILITIDTNDEENTFYVSMFFGNVLSMVYERKDLKLALKDAFNHLIFNLNRMVKFLDECKGWLNDRP